MDATIEDLLRKINVDIADSETKGDRAFFDELLAPTFAFRRASGSFDDRQIFLAGLRRGDLRRCEADSIQVTTLGDDRAFVTCIVRMETKEGWKRFHNARLFVLDATKSWRLLAWANEAAKS